MIECTISKEEVLRLKGLGFLRDKTTSDCFNARVITVNGKVTSDVLKVISKASKLYGSGEVCLTTRMTFEIQKIPYENIDKLCAFLKENGLETGGTGPKVRPIVSCKGTTCQYGLIDTFNLSEKIHYRFYKGFRDLVLPHKFKIAVGGCPNNCVKPDLNDIGVIGYKKPILNFDKCKKCKVCTPLNSCPMKAVILNEKVSVNNELCNGCGRCANKCPFGVFDEYKLGYNIYIGGRWGKIGSRGKKINYVFNSEEEVLDAIERIILMYKEKGIKGERFADTINRIGFDVFEKEIIGMKDND